MYIKTYELIKISNSAAYFSTAKNSISTTPSPRPPYKGNTDPSTAFLFALYIITKKGERNT